MYLSATRLSGQDGPAAIEKHQRGDRPPDTDDVDVCMSLVEAFDEGFLLSFGEGIADDDELYRLLQRQRDSGTERAGGDNAVAVHFKNPAAGNTESESLRAGDDKNQRGVGGHYTDDITLLQCLACAI